MVGEASDSSAVRFLRSTIDRGDIARPAAAAAATAAAGGGGLFARWEHRCLGFLGFIWKQVGVAGTGKEPQQQQQQQQRLASDV